MAIIHKVMKKGIDAEENDGQACGCKKDNVNEPTAANAELERSGGK